MASTTSTKARILRCVRRRDGVSIGSSVAKQSRGRSTKVCDERPRRNGSSRLWHGRIGSGRPRSVQRSVGSNPDTRTTRRRSPHRRARDTRPMT
jgi:hypothetical protein